MPICPYCKKPVSLDPGNTSSERKEVNKEVYGVIKKEIMYSCPHCDSILGFGSFIGGVLTGRP